MATLSAGSSWISFQGNRTSPVAPGTKYEVLFVSFERAVPSNNPAFPPQDVLTVELDGETKKAGCGSVLSRVFRSNDITPGTGLVITYLGLKPSKKPGLAGYHDFKVDTMDATEATAAAPIPSVQPAAVVDTELADRLAAARKRRAS